MPRGGIVKPLCKYGHDTRVVGRNGNGACRECCRTRDRAYGASQVVKDKRLEKAGRWGDWRQHLTRPVPLQSAKLRHMPDLETGNPHQWVTAWETVKSLVEKAREFGSECELDYNELRRVYERA